MEDDEMNAGEGAPQLWRGLGARIAGKIDDCLKASFLWNLKAIQEAKREQCGRDVLIRDNRFHIIEAVEWLKRAQDATPDRGVSRGYSVGWNQFFGARGWQPSYPETTGYIIPTMFDCAAYLKDEELRRIAVEMADWEIDVQMQDGAVMGGILNAQPSPAVFNTGQVMLGWLRTFQETQEDKYLDACRKAGDFLINVQEPSGAWRRGNSRFADSASTTYNSRVGWALILLGQQTRDSRYAQAGQKNIDYSIGQQNLNGWFRDNCLNDSSVPLLHTICYAIEGILGAAEALQRDDYYGKAKHAADALLEGVRNDGSLPGRLDGDWKSAVGWSCLTGDAQLAAIWLRLFAKTGDERYKKSAGRVVAFLKSTQNCVTSNPGLRGGIKGSSPFDGQYGRFEVLSWATKFFIDALLLDEAISIQPHDSTVGSHISMNQTPSLVSEI